mgnify:CR=1 FL=1
MNQLTEVKIEKNPNYGLVVSSRVIANELGKEHKNVLRDLDNIISTSSDLETGHYPWMGADLSTHKERDLQGMRW